MARHDDTSLVPHGSHSDLPPAPSGREVGHEGVWHAALPSDRLAAGKLAKVRVAGKTILLARLEDGTPAAASPVCPHEQADLTQGSVYMGAVDCPRHHYLYDLRTGENRYPRKVFPADLAAKLENLPLYRVKEENGWIWIADESLRNASDKELEG